MEGPWVVQRINKYLEAEDTNMEEVKARGIFIEYDKALIWIVENRKEGELFVVMPLNS
jgi:hypothetical protein